MDSNKDYHLGLLFLVHLLISADGIVDEHEARLLRKIKENEEIPDDLFQEFQAAVNLRKDREIYQRGIEQIGRAHV